MLSEIVTFGKICEVMGRQRGSFSVSKRKGRECTALVYFAGQYSVSQVASAVVYNSKIDRASKKKVRAFLCILVGKKMCSHRSVYCKTLAWGDS